MPGVTESEGRGIVRLRSEGICELCQAHRAQEWQHRKNRSQGGTWSPANGLHVCSRCHADIHHEPADSMAHGWMVPSHTDPATVPVLLKVWPGHGWYWLLDWGGYAGPYERQPADGIPA